MTAYFLAALDMAGTTVDEGGLVYSAVEDAVAEAVGGPIPVELMLQWKGTSKEEAIAGLLRGMGVRDVRRVLTAGDTPNDLGAGMNAGAGFVVGVTTGSFTRSQLEAEPHTHILDSVAELPTLL